MSDAVSAPNSVNYGDQLPLGIEAKSQKRLFFPTTGDKYSPSGNNICRIDINYDGLLDTAQSVLEFTLRNTSNPSGAGAGQARGALDLGQSTIKKLTISSGGVVLEEIHDYNTLVGGFLIPANAGKQTLHYESMNMTAIDFGRTMSDRTRANVAAAILAGTAAGVDQTIPLATVAADPNVAVADNAEAYGTPNQAEIRAGINVTKDLIVTATNNGIIKCVNEILLTGGYGAAGAGIPLISANGQSCLVTNAIQSAVNDYAANQNNGTLEQLVYTTIVSDLAADRGSFGANESRKQHYKLVSGLLDNDKYLPLVLMNAGITLELEFASGNEAGASPAHDFGYEITEVRYAAHLIDLERSFYDRLRMVQQASGGVLQIAGQSYRGFRGTIADGAAQGSINCPARVRSIKSFFFGYKRPVVTRKFNVSALGHNNLSQFQLSIGATRYPPTPNTCDAATNKSGAYTELMKAFGKIGSTVHSDLCSSGNYMSGSGADNGALGLAIPFSPFAIDLESFRHEIENGIDSSSRALPITLHTQHSGAGGAAITAGCNDVYMFVLYDSLFYVNMDGSVSVSS